MKPEVVSSSSSAIFITLGIVYERFRKFIYETQKCCFKIIRDTKAIMQFYELLSDLMFLCKSAFRVGDQDQCKSFSYLNPEVVSSSRWGGNSSKWQLIEATTHRMHIGVATHRMPFRGGNSSNFLHMIQATFDELPPQWQLIECP